MKHKTCTIWAKFSTKCVHEMIIWKLSAQLDIEWESLNHIMYGCSPKKPRIDKNTNWRGYRPCISPGDLVTLYVPIWKSWSEEHLVHQGEQMYQHIAYELRYRNLSLIEHGSICMKAQFI